MMVVLMNYIFQLKSFLEKDIKGLFGDVVDVIKESVEVIDVMKPIYNFKASE